MRCVVRRRIVSLLAASVLAACWSWSGERETPVGDEFVEIAVFTNTALEPEAWFGNMAISDNTIVVGAHGDDHGGRDDAGSATVFVGGGSRWTYQGWLIAPDGRRGDKFGLPIAISGDTIAVSAVWHDYPAWAAGAVYVFDRVDDSWVFRQKLTFSDHEESDRCGVGLDIDGNTIVVGCTDGCGAAGGSPGKVHVFDRSDWVWTEQQVFTAPDVGYNDYFGDPLSLVGDTLVIGSRGNDHSGQENAGAAYVYTRSGDTWTFDQKIIASDAKSGDSFGAPLDFDGDTIVVGSPFQNHSDCAAAGSAYVFNSVGGVWTEQQKLVAESPIEGDVFGWSTAVWSEAALVGTSGPFRDPNTWETTAADFYAQSGDTLERRHRVTGGELSCWIGWYVAGQRNLALVSGCDKVLGLGAVHVFLKGPVFLDGFESGDFSGWTTAVP